MYNFNKFLKGKKMIEKNKERFGRIGFILAAAGSAVGLGNIWKFPYITGENGGGVFVLVYLLTVVLIGMSIFLAEVLIGKKANSDTVSAFEGLATKGGHIWKAAGFTIFIGLLILSFYSVVIGWIFHYIVVALTALPTNMKEAEEAFMTMLQVNWGTQLFYFSLAMFLIAFIVSQGVKRGIEKVNLYMMPAMMTILVVMLVYATTMSGFGQSLEFLFSPNFEKFNTSSIIVAVGHAFFTLSIGMAVILTYASSIGEDTNIVKASLSVVALDTIIALVAGIVIFTITFSSGTEPGKGAGLVFITLPALFYEMGTVGSIMAIFFFISLAFAGLTSAISILEPMVMYLENRWDMTKSKATYGSAFVVYLVGILALLANTKDFGAILTIGSKNLFDWFDFLTAAILMPLGGIVIAVFVGYFMDKDMVRDEVEPLMGSTFYNLWMISLRYIVPIAITLVLLNETGIWKI